VLAFAVAATESDGDVGASLQAVAARAGLGADVAGGLHAVADRSLVAGQWSRLAVCWQLAAEQGLGMTALMRAAQRDIVERQRFADRVQAGLAGARATALILAGLPVLGVLLGQLIGARPVAFLAGAGIGGWLLVTGVMLVCLGLLWADRITERTVT
jgi:tight adherence protein B